MISSIIALALTLQTVTEELLNETASRFIQSAEQLPDLKNDIASGQRLHMIIKARRLLSAAPYKA
mgnify:FL=1